MRERTILKRRHLNLEQIKVLNKGMERTDEMKTAESQVQSLEELHAYVHQTLCESENLLSEQFQTSQTPLYAQGQLSAIQFSLQGLRSVRLGAIWAADQNVIYFYNARGERYLKVSLTEHFDTSSLQKT